MKPKGSKEELKLFPFLPVSIEKGLNISKIFKRTINFLMKLNPKLKDNLERTEIEIDEREYIALNILNVIFVFIMIFLSIFSVGFFFLPLITAVRFSVVFAIIGASSVFVYNNIYPKLIIIKQSKRIEKDLLFALRYLSIRVRSGIPLYDAMVGVAHGDYGEVSKEFKKAVKEIAGGVSDVKALENLSLRSSSQFFRRTIWQIASNMKTGSDISDILGGITQSLVTEHKILIRKYGSELNPIILFYMMFSIIIPALSITVLVVMSSFAGIDIPLGIFYAIPMGVFVLQIVFMSLIKGKRPVLSM